MSNYTTEAQLIQKFNALTEDWTRTETMLIKRELQKYLGNGKNKNTRLTLKLLHSLSGHARKTKGEVDRIGFKLLRYGIFYHKGVGKGRGIRSGKATPRPFLNDALERDIPKLIEIVSSNFADRAVNQARAQIK